MIMNIFKWITTKRIKSRMLIPATRKQYNEFLKGYIRLGGKISHHYYYKYNSSWSNGSPFIKVWIATRDFKCPKLYGASSIEIIVPSDINCEIETTTRHIVSNMEELQKVTTVTLDNEIIKKSDTEGLPTKTSFDVGHNNIFFMDNFSVIGSFIPAYKDTIGYDKELA